MADAFDYIVGQPAVRDFLRATVVSDHVGQAYLFAGAAGSNKTLAAYAFARALLCPKGAKGPRGGGCGACKACMRVGNKNHPDVHYYEPASATGYLVEQIREITADVALAPIQGSRKVYIIDRVDRLGTAPANAFLKTLEEPPEDVVFILLGRTVDSVLPTIVSRCQIVPFRHIPASEAAAIIVQNTGANTEQARWALEACGGSITRAAAFLNAPKNEPMEFRRRILDVLGSLRLADNADVLDYAASLVEAIKLPVDVERQALEAELEENRDLFEKSVIRQIEARNKRRISAKTAESQRVLTSVVRSWLRDIMAVCAGTPELVINTDARESIDAVAARSDVARVTRALRQVDRCDEALAYNVSPETCIDALLFETREVLL